MGYRKIWRAGGTNEIPPFDLQNGPEFHGKVNSVGTMRVVFKNSYGERFPQNRNIYSTNSLTQTHCCGADTIVIGAQSDLREDMLLYSVVIHHHSIIRLRFGNAWGYTVLMDNLQLLVNKINENQLKGFAKIELFKLLGATDYLLLVHASDYKQFVQWREEEKASWRSMADILAESDKELFAESEKT